MAMTGCERAAAARLVVVANTIAGAASINVFGVVGMRLSETGSRWRLATGSDPHSTPASWNSGACNKPACERFPAISDGLGPSRAYSVPKAASVIG